MVELRMAVESKKAHEHWGGHLRAGLTEDYKSYFEKIKTIPQT
jgi:hypothetical protein